MYVSAIHQKRTGSRGHWIQQRQIPLTKRGTLFGTIGFEVVGGPDAQRLVLEFPLRSASGETLAPVAPGLFSGEQLDPLQQIICCYWRQAHYGGRYLMFACSEC
jgi:hypothetical protein